MKRHAAPILATLVLAGCLGTSDGVQPPTAGQATPSPSPIPTVQPTPAPEPTVVPSAVATPTPEPTPDTSVITTVLGIGLRGVDSDGTLATEAKVDKPSGIAIDQNGRLVWAEAGAHRVRTIAVTGHIQTLAGTVDEGFAGDDGPATGARLSQPVAVAVDKAGSVYIADWGNRRIRKVDALTKLISTVAGVGSSRFDAGERDAKRANLANPYGVALDAEGNLLFADAGHHVVRRVDRDGRLAIVAGVGSGGYSGDGGLAAEAALHFPRGVAVDQAGNIYIVDSGNHRLRKVDAAGTITTVAGTGEAVSSGDGGPATAAGLHDPYGVAVDRFGNVYVSEYGAYRVRRIDPTGRISTVAGTGERYYSGSGLPIGEGGPATKAALAGPMGLAVDGAGNLYIADVSSNANDHRVRKVTFTAP